MRRNDTKSVATLDPVATRCEAFLQQARFLGWAKTFSDPCNIHPPFGVLINVSGLANLIHK